jgi:hypothetical protein
LGQTCPNYKRLEARAEDSKQRAEDSKQRAEDSKQGHELEAN